MTNKTVVVPDIGGAEGAEVVELLVSVGDVIELEQSLIVLESDKASMEIPSAEAGTVTEIRVAVGDQLSEGDVILMVESPAAASEAAAAAPGASEDPAGQLESETASETDAILDSSTVADVSASASSTDASSADEGSNEIEVLVPDIGTDGDVEVVELCVSVGDTVAEGDSLVVLESDKASMEVPSTHAGEVLSILVSDGSQVKQGSPLVVLTVAGVNVTRVTAPPASKPASTAEVSQAKAEDKPAKTEARRVEPVASDPPPSAQSAPAEISLDAASIYVGPAVRKLAREFGVDLTSVRGSGPKGRIVKEDLHTYVSKRLAEPQSEVNATGSGIPLVPEVDFSKFGEIRREERSRIDKVTAANMSRSWLNVPHVTQFDDADITELEAFRQSLKQEAERRGSKLSPVPFIIKATAIALNANPKLKSSLAEGGEALIYKSHCHIGMAVDTPSGLVVPVIKDVDKKSIWELSDEIRELAAKAKEKKLRPGDMQGAVFTVSSLGNIGGRGFTPIVNAPEVAILGVSKASTQPVWDGEQFAARVMLPLSLSYDHRVVNGGDGGRFLTYLVQLLADIRQLAMH
jgi:pyruvate dehydrogenase E2 component (dihydrolipoamide acetyltransferase)